VAIGDRACRGGGQRQSLTATVKHDEIVAKAVHFAERDRAHGPAYKTAATVLSNAATAPRRLAVEGLSATGQPIARKAAKAAI
jgi:hypothetical protein